MSLSSRGEALARIGFDHGPLEEYHPLTNPHGTVKFLYAENRLMHDALATFINTNSTPITSTHLSYNEGYTGTSRLRAATATHLNTHFHIPSHQSLTPESITFAAGATALNEALALTLCDPRPATDHASDANASTSRDAILLAKYNYGAFPTDFAARTGVELVYAKFNGGEQFCGGGEDESVMRPYERAFEEAKGRGCRVRAVVLCNPNNPLGRCYSRQALAALMHFCRRRALHLISDEIYALSVYEVPGRANEHFTSVLAIDHAGLVDSRRVHVLYGLSKDYAAGGLRLGCLISHNEALHRAVRGGVCRFSSPSSLSMEVAARMLEDRGWMNGFLRSSVAALARQRVLAEGLLDEAGVGYYRGGNAGLFMWLDLSPCLRLDEVGGDGWAAERMLTKRLLEGGVVMSTGERYQSEEPGRYRMVFSYDEATLQEGIRR
ncbi:uncharacterized protein HMPREF1541_07986 [Cyphellophora europaea CBS 101466]|uniref:Aminotransferase class I/classII large domain-containing protein n=1 Tax=Cyphellophora europaea (strain CBS 101466) TaxID=1220924 RepID=W2RMS3_CYPE1|nr:uncharacterized protein HMPREF1541_07986 [Cyphellophora europaea CBS 101466]ETN36998.1 hypothetical protein HMPREF1541_07986 [Cyphellophora europaea CBS 101466]